MRILKSFFVLVLVIIVYNTAIAVEGPGIYGGGPIYHNRDYAIDELRNSGFTWVCIWTIHVMNEKGDLSFNAEYPLVEGGQYIGETAHPDFDTDVALLKKAPTTIEWVEFGLSGWGSGTFGHIRDLVNKEGTAPGTILYENFKALKEAIPAIDAISFDDEDFYDEPTTTKFAIMLADLGYKVSICPYTKHKHWQNVVQNVNTARPGTIEDVHIQCYAGGSKNDACKWSKYFPADINVMPGVEDSDKIGEILAPWNAKCELKGAWLWLYDDFDGNPDLVKKYAHDISVSLKKE